MAKRKPVTDAAGSAVRPVSLRDLAKHLGLSTTTVSLVLNQSKSADSIPQETKDRVFAAAEEIGYRPNFLARSLRSQRTYAVGVLVPELSDGYSSLVLSGIEDFLFKEGYMYLLTSHRHNPKLMESNPRLLIDRRVEGVIAVDTPMEHAFPVPVVSVSGHGRAKRITNIVLDHDKAAQLGLTHLAQLGHRSIAVIHGQAFSSDSEVRFQSIAREAEKLGIPVQPALVAELETDSPSPEVGYLAARRLLASGTPFTALFAFNDISAIGAIRAFRDANLEVPRDVSVVGFDDIHAAAFHNPALTTIRQPLWRMGALAAETLLNRIRNPVAAAGPDELSVDPELVIRESTGPVSSRSGTR